MMVVNSLLCVLCVVGCFAGVYSVSVVMTMICRDEEVNLKTNLVKWFSIVDKFVFIIDKRTTDNSVNTIKTLLSEGGKQFKIIFSEFDGFGSARTLSLTEAWNNFPTATHVLIADPDWIPDLSTMNKRDLEIDAEVYRFTVFDRNGITRRKMDWFLKHRQGLAMRYNLHEVLDIGRYNRIQQLNWVVHEVEKAGSWHTTVGHGHSMSTKRWEFDLQLLQKDLLEHGHDPHTHYYLGITNQAIASAHQQSGSPHTPASEQHLRDALYYLELRVRSQYTDEFVDERWACMYLLGLTYSNVQRDVARSIHWLSMCRDYNPRQSECGIALARVYLANGIFDSALKETEAVLRTGNEEREYLSHFQNWGCDLPALVQDLFSQKALQGVLTGAEAKYMLLMVRTRREASFFLTVIVAQLHMTRADMCPAKTGGISAQVREVVAQLLRSDSAGLSQKSRGECAILVCG